MQNQAIEDNGIHKVVVSCKEYALDIKHTKLKKVFKSLSENLQQNFLNLGKQATVDEFSSRDETAIQAFTNSSAGNAGDLQLSHDLET